MNCPLAQKELVYTVVRICFEKGKDFRTAMVHIYPIVCYEICDYVMDFSKASEKQTPKHVWTYGWELVLGMEIGVQLED